MSSEVKLPRGLRNNNPLNIRLSSDRWQGQIAPSLLERAGGEASFCQFSSMKYGWRAAFRLLCHTYYGKYKLRTIRALITRWAPPKENDTEVYIRRVTDRIIELGDKKQLVTQEDLPYIVSDVLKHSAPVDKVKLKSYMVSTAYGLKPMASVKLEVCGEVYEESAMGDGMYDAFVRACRHIYRERLNREFPWLDNYQVSIPPGGRTDALVQTIISWVWKDKTFRTRALDPDQTEAAIKATIKMLNIIEQEYEA